MNKYIFLLALLTGIVCAQKDWSSCGTAADHFVIGDIEFSPDPPIINSNFTLTIVGTFDEPITGGNINIHVKVFAFGKWINLPAINVDICTVVDCPIPPGPFKDAATFVIPDVAPAGDYSGNITITDMNKEAVTCIHFEVTMKKPNSIADDIPIEFTNPKKYQFSNRRMN